ncbi:Heat shock protein70 [Phytophthora megakarya]|uniref:Heat shock protein70 n=1 Tax=Phytophthora megakarya TaxID=4795 RepID=A0A225W468_9STRA|nr:Heat shock protein70 [Phytophthora megakarya]
MSGVTVDYRRGTSPHVTAASDAEVTPPSDSATDDLSGTGGCVIGIDFGCTKCEAAVVAEDGSIALIPLELQESGGCISLPSFVSMGVTPDGGWEVGQPAVSRAKAGHPYTIHDLTMLLGQKLNALQSQDVARWEFRIRSGVADKAVVEYPSTSNTPDLVYPEQVAAMLLWTIKHRAEAFIGKRVTGAVITVPAGYNRTQRQALRDACQIAGLRVNRLVISSTASAIAKADSVIDVTSTIFDKTVLVVDYGGRSLNIALARVRVPSRAGIEVDVAATAGNLEYGGEILSNRLFEHFHNEADTTLTTAGTAFSRRLRRACGLAQKILSTSDQASIDLSPWQLRSHAHGSGPVNGMTGGFQSSISRTDFENLWGAEIWSRLSDTVDYVLNRVMQVPKLRGVLGDCFAEHWNRIVDLPKHTAAIGAALVAAQNGSQFLKTEPIPLSLGFRSASGDTLVVVPPSTQLPTQQTRTYYASCQTEITFDILEGLLDPEQEVNRRLATTPNKLEHCIGRVLIDGNRASAPLILKLEITFEVDTTDCLTVVISDKSNDRVTCLQIGGDETCLSAEVIALAQAQLSEMLKNTAATDKSKTQSFSSALVMLSQNTAITDGCPIDALRSSVNKLKPMVQTNNLSVCIPPGDLLLLHSRIEHASTWLEQIDATQQCTNQQLKSARMYLHQIRLFHLSSTASSASSQLRHELNNLDS